MLVFIDESGDPGFKIPRGSSPKFVIALVIFQDQVDAEETSVKIKRLRRDLGHDEPWEFKFNKLKRELRERFFQRVQSCPFTVRAIVLAKEDLYSPHLRSRKESFYKYAVKSALKYSFGAIGDARVFIDGQGSREFKQSMRAYLQRELNTPGNRLVADVRIRDSKSNTLIQLADMVAGAIRRAEEGFDDAEAYMAPLHPHCEDIWRFR